MKRVAEMFYILFRLVFMAVGCLALAVAVVDCVSLFIDLDSLIGTFTELLTSVADTAGEVLEMDLSSVAESAINLIAMPAAFMESSGLVVLVVTFLGMYILNFLKDYLGQCKPVYLGTVKLTAEVAGWAVKLLEIYIGVAVLGRMLTWMMDPNAVAGYDNTFMGIVEFLLAVCMGPLIAVIVLALVHFACKAFYRSKVKT